MIELKDQEIQLGLNCNINYIFKDLYYLEVGLCLDFVSWHIFHTFLSNKDKGITIIRRKKSSHEIKRLLDQPMPHWIIVSETFPYPEKQNDWGEKAGTRKQFPTSCRLPIEFPRWNLAGRTRNLPPSLPFPPGK